MIEKIQYDLGMARLGLSSLPQEILSLHGLNTAPYRHLLNRLGRSANSYLECGVYTGTTLLSACYQNPMKMAVAVDSWRSQAIFERSATYKKSLKKKNPKPGPFQHFKANLERWKGEMPPVHILDGESFADRTLALLEDMVKNHGPFDLVHYDAAHDYQSQRWALTKHARFFAHPCVVVIHDWEPRADSVLKDGRDWTEDVRHGTECGLQDIKDTNPELYRDFSLTPTGEKEGIILVLG